MQPSASVDGLESGRQTTAKASGRGGDAYITIQLAKQFANKKILIVPGSNVSTMNVNELAGYLISKAQQEAARPQTPQPAQQQQPQ